MQNKLINENVVEYQIYPSMEWKPALMEQSVIEELLQTQFYTYLDRVKQTDCQAELRRLLQKGPPIYISDPIGLPIPEEENVESTNTETTTTTKIENDHPTNSYVCKLWYSSDNKVHSAKLHGAVEGIERQQLWDELKQFIIVQGKEKGDDDENVDDDKNNE